MGGVDTRQRYHVHWGAAEQYAERREESALRRSGRPVPDAAFEPFARIDLAPLDAILAEHGFRPRSALRILEADPGRLRAPAGRSAPAHRVPDGCLVQRAVRHRHELPAPALRDARPRTSSRCAAARSARCWAGAPCWPPCGSSSRPTSAASRPTARCASRRPTAAASPATTPRVIVDGSVAAPRDGHGRRRPSPRRCARPCPRDGAPDGHHRGRRCLALDPARSSRHARRRDRHRGGRGRRSLDRLAPGRGHPLAGAGHQAGAQRRPARPGWQRLPHR